MFTFLNIMTVGLLGVATIYITWRREKTFEPSPALYAVRTDGKVVQWNGNDAGEPL